MMRAVDFYIDLGTASTIIGARGRGVRLNEPSFLAVKNTESKQANLWASGHVAKSMLGKTPLNSSVIRPLREGVISDFNVSSQMLHSFLSKVRQNTAWRRPRLLISLPCVVMEHEQNAVRELGYAMGASSVHLVNEPMAAAIGSSLSVLDHRGRMIVDIGGGTSEVVVISLGGVVVSEAIRIGGTTLDEAIARHLKDRYRFVVGEQTAERLKQQVAKAVVSASGAHSAVEVGGIDLRIGLPRKMIVNSSMIFEPVDQFCKSICSAIKRGFEKCPPELAGDIAEDGILLSGGGVLIQSFAERISFETGVPVRLCDNPLTAVAQGGINLLDDHRLFDRIQAS